MKVVRQHPWTLARTGLLMAIILAALIIALVVFKASAITSWIFLLGGGAGLAWTLYRWFTWWNTIGILTSERIIWMTQEGLFSRSLTEIPLAKVQDVSFKVKGLFQTIFNFGVVIVKTASSEDVMRVENIAEPYEMQQEIMKVAKEIWERTPHHP